MQRWKSIRVWPLALSLGFLSFACDSSLDGLKSIQSGSGFVPGNDERGNDLVSDDDLASRSREKGGDLGIEDEGEDDSDESSEIIFPELSFEANGFATCKGDTHGASASVVTQIDEKVLDINMVRNHVDVGSKGQDKADAEMAKSRGHTYYARTPKKKMADLKKDGFKSARFAIFADSVDKTAQQQKFTFDNPLPVYPWPGAVSRYSELEDGSMTWTARVTGHRSFDAKMTISKVTLSDDRVELKFLLDIPGDGTRELYEDFPIPREAIYTIDPNEKDIRRIDSTNWHFGNENCDGNPEQVKMIYKLCKKTTGDKVENIPCG